MKRTELRTDKAPLPIGAYSQGVVADGSIYVAGQGPLNPETGTIPEGIEAQTRQVLTNIKSILAEAGATLDDVVKMNAHLSRMDNFAGYDKVCREFFKPPFPARTTVCSGLMNILVEIDVIAELDRQPQFKMR
jgi:2-iminobutanoate/2-iminopropanoate deaminase